MRSGKRNTEQDPISKKQNRFRNLILLDIFHTQLHRPINGSNVLPVTKLLMQSFLFPSQLSKLRSLYEPKSVQTQDIWQVVIDTRKDLSASSLKGAYIHSPGAIGTNVPMSRSHVYAPTENKCEVYSDPIFPKFKNWGL